MTLGVDAVLLDTGPDMLRQAVEIVGGRAITEASGRIRPDTAPAIAASGVDLYRRLADAQRDGAGHRAGSSGSNNMWSIEHHRFRRRPVVAQRVLTDASARGQDGFVVPRHIDVP